MTTGTLTRPTRTAARPRTGAWLIDSQRAVVAFSGKASFLTPTINARFLGVAGSVNVAETSSGLRGVTKSVPLSASYDVARDGRRMLVRAAGPIDRQAFGISFDLPGGGKLVPRVLRLAIDVDAALAV